MSQREECKLYEARTFASGKITVACLVRKSDGTVCKVLTGLGLQLSRVHPLACTSPLRSQ